MQVFKIPRKERIELMNSKKKDLDKTAGGLPALVSVNGVDFGYNDPTAFVGAYADRKRYKIYIYFEYYERQMENKKIAGALISAGFGRSKILADSFVVG